MDGICHLAGVRMIPLALRGESYTLGTMRLREHAEREAYLLGLKPSLRGLMARMAESPRDDRQFFLDAIARCSRRGRSIGSAEIAAFRETRHGMAWHLARALRQFHPDIATFAQAMALLCRAGRGAWPEITHALMLAEEVDTLADIFNPGGASSGGNFPWAKLYRSLSGQYGWSWREIGELSLYAAIVANGSQCPEDGQIDYEPQHRAQLLEWRARRAANRLIV